MDGRGGVQGPEQGRGLRTAVAALAPEKAHELVDLLATRQVLSEQVSRVHIPSDLSHLNCPRSDFLLHPESVSLQVSQLAKAGSC